MRTKEQFLQYAKQGHPRCPKDYYYIGKGEDESPSFADIFDRSVYAVNSNGSLSGRCGIIDTDDYFVPIKVWEEKFGPLDSKPDITLSEIKAQYEAAKLLMGKRVAFKGDLKLNGEVKKVKLIFDESELVDPFGSESIYQSFKKNGYVIGVVYGDWSSCFERIEEVIKKQIKVKNTSGTEYIAEDKGEYWQFGCAKIAKVLIKEAHNLFDKYDLESGYYKRPNSIQIGDGIFTREILKELVEAAK